MEGRGGSRDAGALVEYSRLDLCPDRLNLKVGGMSVRKEQRRQGWHFLGNASMSHLGTHFGGAMMDRGASKA